VSGQDNGASNGSPGARRRRGRRRGGNGQRPRGSAAMFRRKVEEKLFGKKGDRARLRLIDRLRESHGTPNFERTYREYLKGYGLPDDLALLLMLLDLEHEQDVIAVLGGIEAGLGEISVEEKSLLRIRLRNLEMSTEHDRVADATAQLLTRL
jgi:hypothetical protein